MHDDQAVLDLVSKYLRSVYEGNTHGLREVFHPNARVEDVVTGSFRSRSADQYIEAVGSRQSPLAAGETFTMAPRAIEVLGDMATVTAELHFLGNHFYNVLSLLRCEGRWLIMHKLFGSADR
ncbi:nuclear transport factor 2 family protein [Dyella dinghuensis]|nr:nuclear transport factor 2 family protein [Dyella dinghuensis]